jgi:hypothetical protein
MKNFEEKEIKDLATVAGGARDPKMTISFTIDFGNFFNGSNNWFDGIPGNSNVDEFDSAG